MELTPDNLAIVYTSSYLHMIEGEDTDKEKEIEQLIQEIGSFENDWRILKMDLTPRGDIIVAVQDTDVATAITEAGKIQIKALKGTVTIPTGPVIEEGDVNFKRYSLRLNSRLDMSIEEIETYIRGKGILPREIIWETKGGIGIPCGGIQIYA